MWKATCHKVPVLPEELERGGGKKRDERNDGKRREQPFGKWKGKDGLSCLMNVAGREKDENVYVCLLVPCF